jgi:hypothetical protein
MQKSSFIDFCRVFKNKKTKIRHLGLCRRFERLSKTLLFKKLVLKTHLRFFSEKHQNFLEKMTKIDLVSSEKNSKG